MLPNAEQIADIRKDTSSLKSVPNDRWAFYDEIKDYDVVTGAVPLYSTQQKFMDAAVAVGMPAIQTPFIQVVLITDAGKQWFFFITHMC